MARNRPNTGATEALLDPEAPPNRANIPKEYVVLEGR